MARVRLVPAVLDDLDRIVEHLHQHEVEDAAARVEQIVSAVDVLADNPLIGRPAGEGRRELLIGRDTRGYVALYRYLPVIDTALVLAIRAQREGGYARDE
jgi:plasmid stabilization system protein ParE